MAIGDLVTADWMIEYDGLALGGETAFSLSSVEGLLDLPGIRSSDRELLRRHGAHPGDDFLSERSVVLSFDLYGGDSATLATVVDQFQNAFQVGDEVPLVFQFPGVAEGNKARLYARARKRAVQMEMSYFYGLVPATVELVATDPRIYSNAEGTDSTGLPTAGAGFPFPLTFPWTFGAVSSGGSMILTNEGNFQTPAVFTITGPVTSPRIYSVASGKELHFDVTLASGQTLVIDTHARTVLLDGTASRYSSITTDSEWFDLLPGDNEIQFRAAYTAATLSASWRSAWS